MDIGKAKIKGDFEAEIGSDQGISVNAGTLNVALPELPEGYGYSVTRAGELTKIVAIKIGDDQ